VVWIEQLGLRVGAEVVRAPRDLISAGPAPPHYAEFRTFFGRVAREAPETAARVAELVGLLDLWPAKSLETELKYPLASQFYPKCWELLNEEFRRRHAPMFAQAEEVLGGLVKDLGLTSFYPGHVKDFDREWLMIRVPEGFEQTTSGRVQAVLRPGLREGQTMLVRAIVEVE
jgi:hypothetical protein